MQSLLKHVQVFSFVCADISLKHDLFGFPSIYLEVIIIINILH